MPELALENDGDCCRADSRIELERLVADLMIEVPGQTEGRRSWHREQRCLALYLSARLGATGLSLPFRVCKNERPDFDLYSDDRLWGLEITDAGSEASQRANTLLEQALPGSVIDGEAEIRLPGKALAQCGWRDDEAAQEWSELVLRAGREKVRKIGRAGPLRTKETELLVYDNTHFVRMLGEAGARDMLISKLRGIQTALASVGIPRVSVLSETSLLFDACGEAQLLEHGC